MFLIIDEDRDEDGDISLFINEPVGLTSNISFLVVYFFAALFLKSCFLLFLKNESIDK